MTPAPATPVSTNSSKNEVRTAKSDGVSISATGDKTRDKCAELIYDGLAMDSAYPSDLISKRAIAIEAEVHKNCNGTNQEYKAKIRSLFVNLKDKNNPGLRESVASGDITAARFSGMTSQVGNGIGRAQSGGQQNQGTKFPELARRRGAASRDGRVPVRTVQAA